MTIDTKKAMEGVNCQRALSVLCGGQGAVRAEPAVSVRANMANMEGEEP